MYAEYNKGRKTQGVASMMYHASIYRFDRFRGQPCFTDEVDAAVGYLNGNAGYLYTVEIDEDALVVAGERTVRRIAAVLGLDVEYVWVRREDQPEVREALVAEGSNAASYTDLGPDNAYAHYTLMLLDPSLARIVAVDEVRKQDEDDEEDEA